MGRCNTVDDVASPPSRSLLHSCCCLLRFHYVHDDDGGDDDDGNGDEDFTVIRVRRNFAAADATHIAARVRTEVSAFT